MKKLILLFMTVLLPVVAWADESGTCGDNLSWTYEEATKTLTISGTGTMTNYQFSVLAPWNGIKSTIQYAVIDEGVTTIGNWAFANCNVLNTITIPNSVTRIGGHAFEDCNSLTSIIIPNSVTSIGYGAFNGCSALSSINLPNSLTSIEDNTFESSGLTSITIPEGVVTIGDCAFNCCTSLHSVIIPESVTNIEDDAFSCCFSLTDFYCKAFIVPTGCRYEDFEYQKVTLHVPASAIEAYSSTSPWKKFGKIVAIDEPVTQQCATPTISYSNGKIKFACETEDVEYVPTVTCTPSQTLTSDELELGTTYTVSVYAKREGYLDSEVATSTITLSTVGDVNGDGRLTIADVTSLVNAILGK